MIAVAAALGLGLALWYQDRPVSDTLPTPATMPDRKTVLRPFHPDVIPTVAPMKTDTADAALPGDRADGTRPRSVVPVPSQSPVNAWQHTAVDPMAHIQVTPFPNAAPSGAVSPAAPPADASAVTPGTASAMPSTTTPGSLPAASAPASSTAVSPFVTTAPPADGTSAAPRTTPGL